MIALALLALALLALLLALAGAVVPGWRGEAQWLLLVDRSDSMPRDATDRALAQAVQRLHDGGAARVRSIDFAGRPASGVGRDAGRPRLPPDPADPRVAAPGDGDLGTIEPSATDIESAVDAALALHARQPLAGLVVVSDGFATRGDTQRALRAAAAAGVSVSWIEVGRPPPALHLDELLVPDRAVAGAPVALGLRWQGQHAPPMRVRATARQADGEVLRAEADVPAGAASATLVLAPRVPGPVVVDLEAVDAGSGRTLDAWPSAGLIEVATPAPVLLLRGGDGPLAASLRAGGWPVDVVPAARAAAYRDALASYRAIVLDDVAIADAPAGFWDALAEAVRDHGAGLLVLAGERSLAAGGLLGSTLESLLPVRAEPPALDDTTFVVFAVDKSGSMGLGRAGVDRFRLAQRAVVETAGALHAGDGVALLVFDAGARVLLPPTPAPQAATALARDWPATPGGGTRISPALRAAAQLFESAAPARRLLVVVSDGRADDVPSPSLLARLARERVETVWLAVGPDADVAAVERLLGPGGASVLRVAEAAELPQAMRSGVERPRARVERGGFAVRQRAPLPFEPRTLADWPPVQAYATVRAREGARVALVSERGDPLIVFGGAGAGRSAFVATGLGAWAPRWTPWNGWPALAGGLTAWAAASPPGATMSVDDDPAALRIDLELAADAALVAPAALAVELTSPDGRRRSVEAEPVAPGHWRARLADAEAGVHAVRWTSPAGTLQRWHLRMGRSESRTWGVEPAIGRWRAAGLLTDADALPDRANPPRLHPARTQAPDTRLLLLALALALAGIVVDRWRPTLVARWRRGAEPA